ncbi:hypothetical protein [Maricaulis sp. CAU 1757]
MLPLTALACASLAACGGSPSAPAPEGSPESQARQAGLDAMLSDVGTAADATFQPSAADGSGGSLRLGGELADGQWMDLGDDGVGYGADGRVPLVAVRCEADNMLAFTLPYIAPESDEDEAEETADNASGASASMSGSVITERGVATGNYVLVGEAQDLRSISVAGDDEIFVDLEEDSRLGLSMDGTDTVLVPLNAAAIDTIAACHS